MIRDRIVEQALRLLNILLADSYYRQAYPKEIQALFRLIMPQQVNMTVKSAPLQTSKDRGVAK